MLTYRYNKAVLELEETKNGTDVEFHIRLLQEGPCLEAIKRVQQTFDDNRVLTDVLFYAYPEHDYKIIVRQDFYIDFVMELMKQRLLQSVEWTN